MRLNEAVRASSRHCQVCLSLVGFVVVAVELFGVVVFIWCAIWRWKLGRSEGGPVAQTPTRRHAQAPGGTCGPHGLTPGADEAAPPGNRFDAHRAME